MSELNKIALKILSSGKGILAADESNGTMTKRLDSVITMFMPADVKVNYKRGPRIGYSAK